MLRHSRVDDDGGGGGRGGARFIPAAPNTKPNNWTQLWKQTSEVPILVDSARTQC
ncbi:serine/threonine protein kinase [Anopheles sinensis]|uniref:Serine/threonine protein kinase n=1 Tax=Anopheles sinensis TaxID=74873 RepID=A0A084VZ03_ANOSI|nr:serine/threonine protein kinase [Anopheles sinensis]